MDEPEVKMVHCIVWKRDGCVEGGTCLCLLEGEKDGVGSLRFWIRVLGEENSEGTLFGHVFRMRGPSDDHLMYGAMGANGTLSTQ